MKREYAIDPLINYRRSSHENIALSSSQKLLNTVYCLQTLMAMSKLKSQYKAALGGCKKKSETSEKSLNSSKNIINLSKLLFPHKVIFKIYRKTQ